MTAAAMSHRDAACASQSRMQAGGPVRRHRRLVGEYALGSLAHGARRTAASLHRCIAGAAIVQGLDVVCAARGRRLCAARLPHAPNRLHQPRPWPVRETSRQLSCQSGLEIRSANHGHQPSTRARNSIPKPRSRETSQRSHQLVRTPTRCAIPVVRAATHPRRPCGRSTRHRV